MTAPSPAPVSVLVLDGLYPLLGYCDVSGRRLSVWRCKVGKTRVPGVCAGVSGYAALPVGASWQPARYCFACCGSGCGSCDNGWAAQGESEVVS